MGVLFVVKKNGNMASSRAGGVANVVGLVYSKTVRKTNDLSNFPDFMDDYSRGMDMLRLSSDAFAAFAAGLGYPIPNPSIPTAQVSLNLDTRRIEFEINPDFLHKLKDSDIAAVLGHETYHVLLNHLSEMGDVENFPKRSALIDAHECIINDGLPGNIGFETIKGTYRGLERHNQDFSLFSTQEGYDFILQAAEDEQPQDKNPEDSQKSDSNDPQNGDSSDSGTNDDQKKDEDKSSDEKSDENPDEKKDGNSSDGDGDNESDAPADEDKGDSEKDENSSESGTGDASDDKGEGSPSSGQGDASDNASEDGACHGVRITGEAAEGLDGDALKELIKEVLGDALNDALAQVDGAPLPGDVQEMLDSLEADADIAIPNNDGNSGNGFGMNQGKNGFNTVNSLSNMSMNWVNLLAAINPKIKSAGRPKSRDSWHAPRRRMLHSYPSVILPTTRRLDDGNKKKGDSIPTFILALDMSVSIPEKFLGDLAALASSLPENLIKGFPITWSDNFRIFNPERPHEIVPRSGTRIDSVMRYAEKVKLEEGVAPYVLVITDGQFSMPSYADAEEMKSKWFWMALQTADKREIQKRIGNYVGPKNLFDLKDFI